MGVARGGLEGLTVDACSVCPMSLEWPLHLVTIELLRVWMSCLISCAAKN